MANSDQITIYHNPRCTKSRLTLDLLKQADVEPDIIEYLKTPPSAEKIREILGLLGLTPRQLLRTREAEFNEAGLDNPDISDEDIIQAMVKFPILIERPIVIKDGKAAIGRPPELVLEIL